MTTIPTMVPVQSSNVESIGYQPNELHVRFKKGGHYVYYGAADDLHEALLTSESKGRFIGEHLKGKFETKRLLTAS